jgi:hypothetical protein
MTPRNGGIRCGRPRRSPQQALKLYRSRPPPKRANPATSPTLSARSTRCAATAVSGSGHVTQRQGVATGHWIVFPAKTPKGRRIEDAGANNLSRLPALATPRERVSSGPAPPG